MYKIIDNLPIDYSFNTKSREVLKLYNLWFDENKKYRLNELESLIISTVGYESWKADFSKDSLLILGRWLKENVEIEKLSEKEYVEKKSNIPSYIDFEDWDLTIKTRSILIDVGIYFGEVFIKNQKGLIWKQYFSKKKNDADHGHMIITLKKRNLNPIRIMLTVGFIFGERIGNEKELIELYEVWKGYC